MVYSLYLHIPFCRQRCSYCDFNTYAGRDELLPAYVDALNKEIAYVAKSYEAQQQRRLKIHTVYFGGGTPSLLPIEAVDRILRTIIASFDFSNDSEITMEANPETLTYEYLRAIRLMGINRLSLGVQSSRPQELRLLGRHHTFEDVIDTVCYARRAGFENVNLDLIYGLPAQTMANWKGSLSLAEGLRPEHLSLYALDLDHDTPMRNWVRRGWLPQPDPDLAADMYEWASAYLDRSGFEQYEISNWARQHCEGGLFVCLHNLQYWRSLPYLGLGAGAHGYASGMRTINTLSPQDYIRRLQSTDCGIWDGKPFPMTPATGQLLPLDPQSEMSDYMIMGLRLTQEGINAQAFQSRFSVTLEETYGDILAKLTCQGLLEWVDVRGVIRLTPRGRLLGNQVFMAFI